MVTRQQIVEEARKWLRTPFQHQGRLRGIGVDCVGLPLCVVRDLGLGDWLEDYKVYPAQPVADEVLMACRNRLCEVPKAQLQPGDVIVFRVPKSACHAAIRSDRGVIHAWAPVGRVVETGMSFVWWERIAGVFAIPGVE
jgi:NlpC/P60 family putative phage cell wall peptidase